MALERGKFGIEYNPRNMRRDSSGLGIVVAVVAAVALVSLCVTLWGRIGAARERTEIEKAHEREVAEIATRPAPRPAAQSAAGKTPPDPAVRPKAALPAYIAGILADSAANRPVKVRNLLMRLEEAERLGDVEMAVTTIEQLRALPGGPAADIDDRLARRIGALNLKRLFVAKTPLWIKEVAVKRGDNASRIAAENGSTLASLARLNGSVDVDKLRLGEKIKVMNHPRFNLVVHRRTRTADLSLNGKFFKRYDLAGEVTGREGAYELPAKKRTFWTERGIKLRLDDRAEIEMLMPAGSGVVVSEM
jgi:hypothetical protein